MDFGSLKSSRVAKISLTTILDKIKWNSKPPSPLNQGWSHAKGKFAPFSHPWFGGGGGAGGPGFSFILSKVAILDKIKWNSKPLSPPNQGWSHAKGKNVPFSHPWFGGGGGGGLGFQFILSKIVGDWWRVRIRGSPQHIPTQAFLKYLPRFGSFLFPHSLDPPLFFSYYEDQD